MCSRIRIGHRVHCEVSVAIFSLLLPYTLHYSLQGICTSTNPQRTTHCVTGELAAHGVFTCPTGARCSQVDAVALHPNYSASTLLDDLALVRLSAPLNRSAAVHEVCLPASASFEGAFCALTGFGSSSPGALLTVHICIHVLTTIKPFTNEFTIERIGSSAASNALRWASMPVLNHTVCERLLANASTPFAAGIELCAGDLDGDDGICIVSTRNFV